MNLFRLDASILPASSASSELADLAQAEWTATHPEGSVVHRHLGTDPLPADAWALATTQEGERSEGQVRAAALAATLADELREADAVVMAVPLYNYGVSQHFKTWVDLVIAGAGPTDTLLKDKPTVLVTPLGGGYGPGTPREGWDHSTAYLERIVRDLWQADLVTIRREFTLAATTPGIESLQDMAAEEYEAAKEAARQWGRKLTGR